MGKYFVTYRDFWIPLNISCWILQRNYYNLFDKIIAFGRIKRIHYWNFSNKIKYRRYGPTFVRLTDIFHCLEVTQKLCYTSYTLYCLKISKYRFFFWKSYKRQYFYSINYNSYFLIFTRKVKKLCKSVSQSQNICPYCNLLWGLAGFGHDMVAAGLKKSSTSKPGSKICLSLSGPMV